MNNRIESILLIAVLAGSAFAFPVNGIIDNFNRADESPLTDGGAWTRFDTTALPGTLKVVGNQCLLNAAATGSGYYRNPAMYIDAEVYCTIVTKPADTMTMELVVRLQGTVTTSPNGYKLRLVPAAGTDVITLRRMTAGVTTQLASFSQEVSNGDSLGLSVAGTVLTAWYRSGGGAWASLGTYDFSGDATKYTLQGFVGVTIWPNAGAVIDGFGGGNIGSFPITIVAPTLLFAASGSITTENNVQGLTQDAAADWYWGVNRGAGIDSRIYHLNAAGVTQGYFTSNVEHGAVLVTVGGGDDDLCVSYWGAAEIMDFDGTNQVLYDLSALAGTEEMVFGWITGDTFMVRATSVGGDRVWHKVTLTGGVCTLVKTYTTGIVETTLGRRQGGCWFAGKQYLYQDENAADSGPKCVDEWSFDDGTDTAEIAQRWSWNHTIEGEGMHTDGTKFYVGDGNKEVWQFDYPGSGSGTKRRIIVSQ